MLATQCTSEGAILKEAHLEDARFLLAHLAGADLSHAHPEGAKLSQTDLRGAILTGAQLEGADLSDVKSADLSEAHVEPTEDNGGTSS